MWEQVDASKRMVVIRRKLESDVHWKKYHADKNSDAEMLEYVQSGLGEFVERIEGRMIRNGTMVNYEGLEAKAKWVVSELQGKDEEEQIAALVDLGKAPYYCPERYKEEVDILYAGMSRGFEQESLMFKAHKALDFEREHLFQQFVHWFKKANQKTGMHRILNVEDVHNYNFFLNFLGDSFSISIAKEDREDPLSYISVLEKRLLAYIYGKMVALYRAKMEEEGTNVTYDVDRVRDVVQRAHKNGEIPFPLLKLWFIDEWKKEVASRVGNQIGMLDPDSSFYHHVIDAPTGEIKQPYLDFFLLKMGAVRKKDKG
jgi:hypothetical protein